MVGFESFIAQFLPTSFSLLVVTFVSSALPSCRKSGYLSPCVPEPLAFVI